MKLAASTASAAAAGNALRAMRGRRSNARRRRERRPHRRHSERPGNVCPRHTWRRGLVRTVMRELTSISISATCCGATGGPTGGAGEDGGAGGNAARRQQRRCAPAKKRRGSLGWPGPEGGRRYEYPTISRRLGGAGGRGEDAARTWAAMRRVEAEAWLRAKGYAEASGSVSWHLSWIGHGLGLSAGRRQQDRMAWKLVERRLRDRRRWRLWAAARGGGASGCCCIAGCREKRPLGVRCCAAASAGALVGSWLVWKARAEELRGGGLFARQ